MRPAVIFAACVKESVDQMECRVEGDNDAPFRRCSVLHGKRAKYRPVSVGLAEMTARVQLSLVIPTVNERTGVRLLSHGNG